MSQACKWPFKHQQCTHKSRYVASRNSSSAESNFTKLFLSVTKAAAHKSSLWAYGSLTFLPECEESLNPITATIYPFTVIQVDTELCQGGVDKPSWSWGSLPQGFMLLGINAHPSGGLQITLYHLGIVILRSRFLYDYSNFLFSQWS